VSHGALDFPYRRVQRTVPWAWAAILIFLGAMVAWGVAHLALPLDEDERNQSKESSDSVVSKNLGAMGQRATVGAVSHPAVSRTGAGA
jgi:hypothetical protein